MKFASKIALFLFSSIPSLFACVSMFAVSFLAEAGTKQPFQYNENGERQQQQPQQAHVSQGKSTSYGETKLKFNQHIAAYLPKDVRSYQPVAYRCNDQGQRSENDVSGGCLDYVSASTHSKWRVRFVQPAGAAERVFKLGDKETPVLRVQFAKGDINNVLYEAPNAKQYAQASANGQLQSSSGVGTVSQPSAPAQATNDCDNLSWAQKIACNATKNGGGVGGTIDAGLKAFKK